jgi:glutathione S-transferase
MKLYTHPVSTTSRPLLMFCASENVDIEHVTVDFFSGEHVQEPYLKTNPNGMVPALDDDGFILTESSAMLKYLAEKTGSATYPEDPQARARVNEIMDWFNSNFYREIGYHLVYPQCFPSHKREPDAMNQSVIDWGLEQTKKQLEILDHKWHTFAGGGKYLTGDQLTIADYFGSELAACGDLIRVDWSGYANVARWLDSMKALPAWAPVHEVIDGFAGSIAETEFTGF